MTLSKDWKEFLELLNSHAVDYVIVGAQSLAFHGRPRHTGDLDILVRPTPVWIQGDRFPPARAKLFNLDEPRAGSFY